MTDRKWLYCRKHDVTFMERSPLHAPCLRAGCVLTTVDKPS